MAETELPEAVTVFEVIGEAPAAYSGCRERIEVTRKITNAGYITTAQALANAAGDGAAAPYDFPLSVTIIMARNPSLTEAEATERYERQTALAQGFVINHAAAAACSLVKAKTDSVTGDPLGEKRRALLQNAKDAKEALAAFVEKLRIGDTTAAGQPSGQTPRGGQINQRRADGYATANRQETEYA